MRKTKGITLIALVITIIILLILAGISIAMLTGENGILTKAMQAVEQTKISEYKEQIELTRTELQMQNENYTPPTLEQMKEALEKKNWVENIEYIIDEDVEKLKLTTEEGYIFYITGTEVEYKGKGEEKDTSALEKEGVLEMKITETTPNGKLVQITDLTEVDYYKIQYQIDSTEGEWQEIKSGKTVEVAYGQKIYAKLVYGSNSGVIHSLSIDHVDPEVTIKSIDTSNVTRKANYPLSNLFYITWGSDGTGIVTYEVTGNQLFQNKSFSNAGITNLSQLELGTYEIKCTITSPIRKVTKVATKSNVKIGTLASTTVTNLNNANVTASAIYSEYDFAHFRDLVNGGNAGINGKLMNNMELSKVCSASIGNWTPIADYTNLNIAYNATFDGNEKMIDNLYVNMNSKRVRIIWKY